MASLRVLGNVQRRELGFPNTTERTWNGVSSRIEVSRNALLKSRCRTESNAASRISRKCRQYCPIYLFKEIKR